MGGDPPDGPYNAEFTPQGVKKAASDATAETDRWDLVISIAARCPVGGRARDNGDVHLQML